MTTSSQTNDVALKGRHTLQGDIINPEIWSSVPLEDRVAWKMLLQKKVLTSLSKSKCK